MAKPNQYTGKMAKNWENRGHVVNLVVYVSCKRGAKSL